MNYEEESLFSSVTARPLADQLRPKTLDEIAGQEHLLGPEGPLRRMVDNHCISSFCKAIYTMVRLNHQFN